MWIRSQDKKGIYKIVSCRILSSSKGHMIEGVSRTGDILGIYSTEEKALKILDMIEKHINKTNIYDVIATENYCKPYEIEKPFKEVFQMPQDEEVLEDE